MLNVRKLITKSMNESNEQESVHLIQKTHLINDHEVEIQSPVLDIVNSIENLSNLDSYKVVIGSETWLTENGVTISDVVNGALLHERAVGALISVLMAVNGKFLQNLYLFQLEFQATLLEYSVSLIRSKATQP
jgi:hypothetical protein